MADRSKAATSLTALNRNRSVGDQVMAFDANTTRRALFAMAGAAAVFPAITATGSPATTSAWRGVIAETAHKHADAPAAIAQAIRAGLDPDAFSAIVTTGPAVAALPVLYFGDWEAGDYFTASPDGVFAYRRFH